VVIDQKEDDDWDDWDEALEKNSEEFHSKNQSGK